MVKVGRDAPRKGTGWVARAATALLALLLLGQAPPTKGFSAPAFGPAVGPYRMGIAIASGSRPGGDIPIRVYFENIGSDMIWIPEAPNPIGYDAELVDEKGAKVDLTLFAIHSKKEKRPGPTTGHAVTIRPGTTWSDRIRLQMMFDTSLAGRYELTLSRRLPLGKGMVRVSSGTLSFELKDEP